MKKILVPIDFSALGCGWAHFGLKLAQGLNARVVLLHVVEPARPLSVFDGPVGASENWDNVLRDQMTRTLFATYRLPLSSSCSLSPSRADAVPASVSKSTK